MTHLLKPLTRDIFVDGKPYKVILDTDLTITFREKGRKTRFTTSLHACYNLALIDTVMGNYFYRLEEYNRKKANGKMRLRKPKRPFIERAFDPKFVAALKAVKKQKFTVLKINSK